MLLREHITKMRKYFSDTEILFFLHQVHKDSLNRMHIAVQNRINLLHILSECSEDGKIAIVYNGMDCDGCAYEGHSFTVDANTKDFENAVQDLYMNAEGPLYWYILRPSEAKNVKRLSRDLALEAFENGNPWSIHY
jgi:hypothetical protein